MALRNNLRLSETEAEDRETEYKVSCYVSDDAINAMGVGWELELLQYYFRNIERFLRNFYFYVEWLLLSGCCCC